MTMKVLEETKTIQDFDPWGRANSTMAKDFYYEYFLFICLCQAVVKLFGQIGVRGYDASDWDKNLDCFHLRRDAGNWKTGVTPV